MSEISALIVDDSSLMRGAIERALRQAGLEIATIFEASDGVDALKVLREQRVDLILSEINLPRMGGLELLRQLRAQNLAANVPAVMITTESAEEQVRAAIAAGAQAYIRKPFTTEQVRDRVLPLVSTGAIISHS